MLAAAKGRPRLPEPAGWAEANRLLEQDPDKAVRRQASELSLLFGSDAALVGMRAVLADGKAAPQVRRKALAALLGRQDAATLKPLLSLAAVPGPLRVDAVKALANYDDPRISSVLIGSYSALTAEEKSAALVTLVARGDGTQALLATIDRGGIPAKDLTAPVARMIKGAGNKGFDAWLAENYGTLHPSGAERLAEIERYRRFTGGDAVLRADVKNGRAIFERTCAACHVMFGAGGRIGPELPGNFTDIDYLLQNILDPDSVIGRDYQQTFLTLKDGRMTTGIVAGEDAATVTLRTLGETLTVRKEEIVKRDLSPNSMMPAGLLAGLQEPEVRDLFLYLRQSKNP
jgi:putative heme-binding domain-containing protein